MITAISTADAQGAVDPYSTKLGNLLLVTGQLPIDPATGEFSSADVVEQARQCLENLAAIAEAAGTDLSKTVKITMLLTDLGDLVEVSRVYTSFFAAPLPASACYEVKALPKGVNVKIDAVIAVG
ncbi:Rid family detoxifying hydrolase [Ensifer sp. BR816]|uniref:Rid family detoxifying hydrolase n=1 Tax=Rhizobium sp. (strain BR816) TaxID=1057002 RepID=UPI00036EF150|nr:Rid family detoxifying hydrolase [Ensifer sp. BR816]